MVVIAWHQWQKRLVQACGPNVTPGPSSGRSPRFALRPAFAGMTALRSSVFKRCNRARWMIRFAHPFGADISPRFCLQFRQKAEIRASVVSKRTVIPAKAGIHRQSEAWIPAFAGMTTRFKIESTRFPAYWHNSKNNVGIYQPSGPSFERSPRFALRPAFAGMTAMRSGVFHGNLLDHGYQGSSKTTHSMPPLAIFV